MVIASARKSKKVRGFLLAVFVLINIPALNRNAFAAEWPLGKLSIQSSTSERCPKGHSCTNFTVQCAGVNRDQKGRLAVAFPGNAPRGLVLFLTGGSGRSWWSGRDPEIDDFVEDLRSSGFVIVQVKWSELGWLISGPGNETGIAHLACRPATVIQYVHEKYYKPLRIKSAIGTAGFCAVGSSGGASQVSYSLSHYGLSEILDVAIPTGGPPHAALAKSCMNDLKEKEYWFPPKTRRFIDRGFGYFRENGPCLTQDASFIPRWNEESVSTGGNSYYYPRTRVSFIFGEKDKSMQHVARDYFQNLRTNKSPYVTWKIVPNTGHSLVETKEGLSAIRKSILATTSVTEEQ